MSLFWPSSVHTLLPYDYYSLKFCKPSEGVKKYSENLGEFLRGDRIENSAYDVRSKINTHSDFIHQTLLHRSFLHAYIYINTCIFLLIHTYTHVYVQISLLEEEYCKVLCQVDLKTKDVDQFKQAIKRFYHTSQ